MNISAKDRYRFIIQREDGEYFQAWNIYEEDRERKSARWTASKASAKKYESMLDAREDIGKLGGGIRLLRYDMLTTRTVDVWDEMRRPPERRWICTQEG